MARYNGRHGQVYLSASGSAAATSMAQLSSWSLDMAKPMADATALGDANQQYSAGIPNLQGAFAGVWDDTNDVMYDAAMQTEALRMYLYPSSLAPTKYWYGLAHVDFSPNVVINETITFSSNFAAAGDWGQM